MTDRKTLEDLAREAANAIEDEWDMCGLTGGLYEDYSVEVAKRVAALIRAQALDEAAVTPSEALYAFAGWLTSRQEVITMSEVHDAAPAADAVRDFCASQCWADPRPNYIENIKPYPGRALKEST